MLHYRVRMVEPISLPSREDRSAALERAGYNVFNLDSEDVFVDLLTDSGTGTMSTAQWAAMFEGDEAYAGSRSFHRLREAVEDVTGLPHTIPAHQGRGAENALYGTLLEEGDVVLNNTHFDTTRAHVANQGAEAVDCPVEGAWDHDSEGEFLGNFSLERAWEVVDEVGAERIPVVVSTITNNSAAGQPVSLENLRETAEFAREIDALFVLDACRFAENAHFVRERESGSARPSLPEVARAQFEDADAVVVSGKKDGLVNIGGFVACREESLADRVKARTTLYEGFPTYGGMAGRDLAAMAVGLREAVEPPYVAERVGQVAYLGGLLADADLPVFQPTGGHAVYLDAGAVLSDIPAERFPAQRFVVELYRESGVRAVELGEFAFPDAGRPQLVRLALPRRTYTREHLDHVADGVAAVADRAGEYEGLEVVTDPPMPELRHFSARLRSVPA
jgi:tryptophanase